MKACFRWYWSVEAQDSFSLKEAAKAAHPRDYKAQGAAVREVTREGGRRFKAMEAAGFDHKRRWNHDSEEAAQLVADEIEKQCGFKPYVFKHSYI
jgi:hypothetical protein